LQYVPIGQPLFPRRRGLVNQPALRPSPFSSWCRNRLDAGNKDRRACCPGHGRNGGLYTGIILESACSLAAACRCSASVAHRPLWWPSCLRLLTAVGLWIQAGASDGPGADGSFKPGLRPKLRPVFEAIRPQIALQATELGADASRARRSRLRSCRGSCPAPGRLVSSSLCESIAIAPSSAHRAAAPAVAPAAARMFTRAGTRYRLFLGQVPSPAAGRANRVLAVAHLGFQLSGARPTEKSVHFSSGSSTATPSSLQARGTPQFLAQPRLNPFLSCGSVSVIVDRQPDSCGSSRHRPGIPGGSTSRLGGRTCSRGWVELSTAAHQDRIGPSWIRSKQLHVRLVYFSPRSPPGAGCGHHPLLGRGGRTASLRLSHGAGSGPGPGPHAAWLGPGLRHAFFSSTPPSSRAYQILNLAAEGDLLLMAERGTARPDVAQVGAQTRSALGMIAWEESAAAWRRRHRCRYAS